MRNTLFKISFLVAALWVQPASGQFNLPAKSWATDVQERVVLVIGTELTPKEHNFLRKHTKKHENDTLNQVLGELFEEAEGYLRIAEQFWPFRKDSMRATTSAEIDSLIKEKNTAHVILEFKQLTEVQAGNTIDYLHPCWTVRAFFPEWANKVDRYEYVNLYNDRNGTALYGRYVFKVSVLEKFDEDWEYRFIFKQFKDYIAQAEEKGYNDKKLIAVENIGKLNAKNTRGLANKTLLIPKELLEVLPSQILTFYQYRHKIVPLADINNILKNDHMDEYCYFHYVWSDAFVYWSYFIVNNTNGNIMAHIPSLKKNMQLKLVLKGSGPWEMANQLTPEDLELRINEHTFDLMREHPGYY